MNVMLLGPPGSGKGTHTQWLAQHLGLAILSCGDLLRAAARSRTTLGLELSKTLARGELAPEALVVQLVHEHLRNRKPQPLGWIFDGFPRSVSQAKHMHHAGIFIFALIHLNLPDSAVIQRLSGRRVHPLSGRTYHLEFSPPQQDGVDDVTAEPLVCRKDDTLEVIQHRLKIYHQTSEPLFQFYAKHSGRQLCPETVLCFEVDATPPINQVRDQLGTIARQLMVSRQSLQSRSY